MNLAFPADMLIPRIYWSRPRSVLEQFLRLLCQFFKCRDSLALANSQSRCASTGLLAGQPQQVACPCCWMKLSIPMTASDFHSLMVTILFAISLQPCSVSTGLFVPCSGSEGYSLLCFPFGLSFLMYLHKSLIHIFPQC